MKLAMRIDSYYRPEQVFPWHWEALAQKCGFPPEEMIGMLRDLSARLPALAQATAAAIREDGIDHHVLDQLAEAIARRCEQLAGRYGLELYPDSTPAVEP